MNQSFDFKELCLNLKKYYYVYIIIFFSAFILCFSFKVLQPNEIIKCSFDVDLSKELKQTTKKEINSALYEVEKSVREEAFIEEVIGPKENLKNEKFKLVDSLGFYYNLKQKSIVISIANTEEESYWLASSVREKLKDDLNGIYPQAEVGNINISHVNYGNSSKYYVMIAVILGLVISIVAFGITLSRRN